MSEGPIKQWRDSWKPPTVSSTDAERVCWPRTAKQTYCGRKPHSGHVATQRDDVTCSDCLAALRADA